MGRTDGVGSWMIIQRKMNFLIRLLVKKKKNEYAYLSIIMQHSHRNHRNHRNQQHLLKWCYDDHLIIYFPCSKRSNFNKKDSMIIKLHNFFLSISNITQKLLIIDK